MLKEQIRLAEAKRAAGAPASTPVGKPKQYSPRQIAQSRSGSLGIPFPSTSSHVTAQRRKQWAPVVPEDKPWYRGSQPTLGETVARIYSVSGSDEAQGEQLYNNVMALAFDPTAPVYSPYMQATNPAVANLAALGVDVSAGVNSDWITAHAGLMGGYRTGTTNTPLAPTSTSTPENDAGYWYYKITEAEETTQQAETEWAALQEEVAYWAGRTDRNYSDEEIVARIDWSDYPTLVRMDEGRQQGVPLTLNRPIGYSTDAIYGAIWAARNGGGTGDPMADAVSYYLGRGNSWAENEEVSSRLDPTSDRYCPYALGTTLDDEALYFGVPDFGEGWLEANRGVLAGNDATARRMYTRVYDAEQRTLQAEAELAALDAEVARLVQFSGDADRVLAAIDWEDYPMLAKMDESLASGEIIGLTRAVPYNRSDFEADVRSRCEAHGDGTEALGFFENVSRMLTVSTAQDEPKQPQRHLARDLIFGARVDEDSTEVPEPEAPSKPGMELSDSGVEVLHDPALDAVHPGEEKPVVEGDPGSSAVELAETPKAASTAAVPSPVASSGETGPGGLTESVSPYQAPQSIVIGMSVPDTANAIRAQLETDAATYGQPTHAAVQDSQRAIMREQARRADAVGAYIASKGTDAEKAVWKAGANSLTLASALSTSIRSTRTSLLDYVSHKVSQQNRLLLESPVTYMEAYSTVSQYEQLAAERDQYLADYRQQAAILAELSPQLRPDLYDENNVALPFDTPNVRGATKIIGNNLYSIRLKFDETTGYYTMMEVARNTNTIVAEDDPIWADPVFAEWAESTLAGINAEIEPLHDRWRLARASEALSEASVGESRLRRQLQELESNYRTARLVCNQYGDVPVYTRLMEKLQNYEGLPAMNTSLLPVLQVAAAYQGYTAPTPMGWSEFELYEMGGQSYADVAAMARQRDAAYELEIEALEYAIGMIEQMWPDGLSDGSADAASTADGRSRISGLGLANSAPVTDAEPINYLDSLRARREYLLSEREAIKYYLLRDEPGFRAYMQTPYDVWRNPAEEPAFPSPETLESYRGFFDMDGATGPSFTVTEEGVMTWGEYLMRNYIREEYGPEAAQQYLAWLDRQLPYRVQGRQAEIAYAYGQDHPFLGAAYSVGANILGGLVGSAYSLVAGLGADEVDPLNSAFDILESGSNTRAGARERWVATAGGKDTFAGKAVAIAFDGLTTIADSSANALLFKGASPYTMGLQSFASTVQDIKLRGGTDAQALELGAVAYLAETVTEMLFQYDFDKALRLGKAKDFRHLIGLMAKDASMEGLGEAASELITSLADTTIMGAMSNYATSVRSYESSGMSTKDAQRTALRDVLSQIGYAGLLGFAVSGFSHLGGVALGATRPTPQTVDPVTGRVLVLADALQSGDAATQRVAISSVLSEDADVQPPKMPKMPEESGHVMREPVMPEGAMENSSETGTSVNTPLVSEADTAPRIPEESGHVMREPVMPVMPDDAMGGSPEGGSEAATPPASEELGSTLVLYSSSFAHEWLANGLVDRAGNEATAIELLAELILGSGKAGIDMHKIHYALCMAVYDSASESSGILAEIVATLQDTGRIPDPETVLPQLLEAYKRDNALNPSWRTAVSDLAVEFQCARHVQDAIANGAADGLRSAQEAIEKSTREMQIAQANLTTATQQLQATQQNLSTLSQQHLADPANQMTRGALQQAIKDTEGDTIVVQQMEQALDQRTADLEAAQTAMDTQTDQILTRLRQEAMAAAEQEIAAFFSQHQEARIAEEARAAEEAARAEEQRQQDNVTAVETEAFISAMEEKYPGLTDEQRDQLREQYVDRLSGQADTAPAAPDRTDVPRGTLNLMSRLSHTFGVRFEVTDGVMDGVRYRGAYQSDGTILINRNATQGEVLWKTLVHELTHHAEKGKAYSDFAQELLGIVYGDNLQQLQADLDAVASRYRQAMGDKYTDSVAFSELVAAKAEDILGNEDVINRLAAEKPSIASRIWQTLKDFVKRIAGVKSTEADHIRRAEALYRKALEQAQKTTNQRRTGMEGHHPVSTQFSITQLADSLGLRVEEVAVGDEALPYRLVDRTGAPVTQITAEDIDKTYLGRLIRIAENAATISGETAAAQRELFAELATLVATCQDGAMIWEMVGAEFFSAVKNNADKQYGKTVDFGTVCVKTKALVDVLSETMVRLGRGLTRDEVLKAYAETAKVDLSVPCAPCYVFSRWIGVPSLLNNMKSYQQRFEGWTAEQVTEYIDSAISKYSSPNGTGSASSQINKKKGSLEKRLATATDRLSKLYEAARTKALTEKQLAKLDKQRKLVESLESQLAEIDAYNWVTQVLCSFHTENSAVIVDRDANGNVVLNPEYKAVPDEVLFDLRTGAKFATEYPWAWRYRTTRGAGMGKAILPYSGFSLGDVIYSTQKRTAADENVFLADEVDDAVLLRKLQNRIKTMKAQNLIGGFRWQSTSDFRPEWGLDYVMTMLEMQACGAKGQLYTKIIEAAEMFATAGIETNLSLIAKGKGYHLDENGKPIIGLEDLSSVSGIDAASAFELIKRHDNAQVILVGLSPDHIRAAMADDRIGFIIPWHASGSNDQTQQILLSAIGESPADAVDFTDVQNDTALKNRTALQKQTADVRTKLLTGKLLHDGKPITTADEMAIINGNEFLQSLYERFYLDDSATETYHAWLSSEQASGIFPYEYWDTNLDIEDADENGKRFARYCESLGLKPRFEQFKDDPGYWKLLIDRRMYNRDGTYHHPQTVDVTRIKTSDIPLNVSAVRYENDSAVEQAVLNTIDTVTGRLPSPDFASSQNITGAVSDFVRGQVAQMNAERDFGPDGIRYRLREDEPPKKTVYAYKAFYALDGKLYPPMVSNVTDEGDKQRVPNATSNTMRSLPTPVGVWLDADVGGIAIGKADVTEYEYLLNQKITALKKKYKTKHHLSKNHRFTEEELASIRAQAESDPKVQKGSRERFVERKGEVLRSSTTKRLRVKNDKGGDELAFRPGWHLGEWPDAKQFNRDDPQTGQKKALMPADLVFARCEVAADVDYQLDAISYGVGKKGKFTRTQAGLPYIPKDGYYKYRTNPDPRTAPWLIAGAIKVIEILDDDDCARICAQFGVTPDKRVGGKKLDLEALGLKRGPVEATTEGLEQFRQNDASRANQRLLDEALADPEFADAYVPREISFDDPEILAEFAMNGQDAEAYKKRYEEQGLTRPVGPFAGGTKFADPEPLLPSPDILGNDMDAFHASMSAPPEPPADDARQGDRPEGNMGESQFASRTAQRSQAIPPWLKQTLWQNRWYERDTNRAQAERAWQRISAEGYDAARERLLNLNSWGADENVEALILLHMALRPVEQGGMGDPALAMDIALRDGIEGTKQGQALQARKLFSRMTPTGMYTWAAGSASAALQTHMENYRPAADAARHRARRVEQEIDSLDGTDPLAPDEDGNVVITPEATRRWGVPINERQQALIDHYHLNRTARPGLHYNKATLKQRMLEAILATPDPTAPTGLGLNLIDRLELMQTGAPVITEVDLSYIVDQMQEYVNSTDNGQYDNRLGDLSLARAYEAYGNITPATAREKARTWRYTSMLLSIPSAARNIIGNTTQGMANATAHGVAVELDRLVSRFTGTRTMAHNTMQERAAGWRAFVNETVNTYNDYFTDHAETRRGNDRYSLHQRGRVFQSAVPEALRTLEGFLMSVGDRNVWRKAYVQSMSEQARVARLNGVEFNPETAAERAIADANYATFSESNAVSEALSGLKRIPVVGDIMDFVMPFTGVPTNIVKRMGQYSPFGLAWNVGKAIVGAARGRTFDQHGFVNGVARGLTGTALFAAGAILYSLGQIKLGTGEEEDKEYALHTAMGQQYTPYIQVGGQYVSLSALAPFISPFIMGATALKLVEDAGEGQLGNALLNAAIAAGDQVFDASYMSNLSDILGGYGSPTENLLTTIGSSMISQNIPSLIGQLASALDPYVRDTRDKDKLIQILNSGLINKLPWLREQLPAKVDVAGRRVENTDEGVLAFIDPFNRTTVSDDPALLELDRLSASLGTTAHLPADALSGSKTSLTGVLGEVAGADKETYKVRYGQLWRLGGTTYDADGNRVVLMGVTDLINTDWYRQMTDAEKAEAIAGIMAAAKAGATYEMGEKLGHKTKSSSSGGSGMAPLRAVPAQLEGRYPELDRMFEATGDGTYIPKGIAASFSRNKVQYNLTGEAYDILWELYIFELDKRLAKIDYSDDPDKVAAAVSAAYSAAASEAKDTFVKLYPTGRVD